MNARSLNLILASALVGLGCWSGYLMVRLRNLESARMQAAGYAGENNTSIEETAANPQAPLHAETKETAPDRATAIPSPESPARKSFHWSTVESEDYESYIGNLRAIGCPEETIRDIVLADINKMFAKRRGLLVTPETPAFWQASPQLTAEQRQEQREELGNLEMERVNTIRRLLGVDPAIEQLRASSGFTYTDNRLGNLPAEKQDQVSLLREEFNQHWHEIQKAAASGLPPDDATQQLRELDGDRLARLRQILTPTELAEHELQTSWTAIQLRQRLAGFNPAETEFRMLYELQKPFDDEYIHYFNGRTDEAALLRKQQEQQRLEEQFRLVLGEKRYAELLQSRR